ncbi:hypothetical protein FHT98_3121 [Bosea sp. AK1]|nr:hypothetical protein FHT98_3121 [Bosea sp. AK1]
MPIVFPEFEYPSRNQKLDMEIASMIKDAHEAKDTIDLLDLAMVIRRHVTEDISDLDELFSISPIYPRPKSMTPREWLAKFKAEGGVLPKPRIRITAAMQRAKQI